MSKQKLYLRGKEHTSNAGKLRKKRKGEKHVNIINEILEAYTQFQTYLSSIQLDELKKQCNRKELEAFTDQLRQINKRELPYELSLLTEEMKKEEYPELLGVRYFPVVKEIDFLTEPEKIALDKMLGRQKPSYFFTTAMWRRVTPNTKNHEPLIHFLIDKGVIKEDKVLVCPHCEDSHLTARLSATEAEILEQNIRAYQKSTSDEEKSNLYGSITAVVADYCDECDGEADWIKMQELCFKPFLTLAAEADRTLDAV